jgi:lysylphosphatidylglycerol synthetase-like protein (DUF2156 family)
MHAMTAVRPPLRRLSDLRAAAADIFDAAPTLAALAAFTIGAVALIVSVTSVSPAIPGLGPLEAAAEEWPEFTESIAGVALMSLALGLYRRLDTAWAGASALLGFLAIYAFVRHAHVPSGIACLLGLVFLIASRRAFYRHAGLAALLPSRPLYLAIAAAVVCAAMGAILWAAERPGFAEAPWWSLVLDAHIGRAGRVAGVAALMLAAIAAYAAMLAPARLNPPPPGADEAARVDALIASGEGVRPEAELAALGDKSFVFAEDGGAVVMAARAGASFVAMGAPIGRRASWRNALSRFRAEADELGLRPVIYAAPPELLPDLLDLGFRLEKVGENAVIDLRVFNLVGARRQPLRTARRRLAEREGAIFAVETAPGASIEDLRPVSDAWLAMHKGGEKSFSLGRFDPAFLARGPVAIVRIKGQPVAFATIWTTHDKAWAAIDLMRYHPEAAPPGTMDFLITEALLWAQGDGYGRFDLGMAPLSGLSDEPNAPLFARLGRLVYEQGGAFYNFDGLRKFKEKFEPDWEPRYLAAPGAWSMPLIIAEIALMTSRS